MELDVVNGGALYNSKSDEIVENRSSECSDDDNKEWWKQEVLSEESLAREYRGDFKILNEARVGGDDGDDKPLVYLDSAATSQKPKSVLDKVEKYYNSMNSNVHRGAHTLSQRATAEYEAARDSVASLINANSRNEIVFTSGATEALNLLAQAYGGAELQPGDEVIITEAEHHSNIVPWQQICQKTGATLKYVPLDTETTCLDWSSFESTLLTNKTKIISIQHVSNVLAAINPIDDVVRQVREKAHPDAIIILDACQSVAHMPVDVQSLGVDFLAASGHKMCGPTGIGFLWGREDLLNSMPPYQGGGEMIDQVTMEHSTYAKAPARFEAGTPPIAQAIGMGAAINYLQDINMERIHKYEIQLAQYMHKRMTQDVPNIRILGPPLGEQRGATVAFVSDDVHPSDLSTFLDMEGVAIRAGHHCCQPLHSALGYSHSARASLYFYNTKEEVDFFIEKLQETLAFFRGLDGSSETDSEDDDFVPFI
eukprot:CAMPEP_0197828276 /NCGR_PEP_ID=MMETSP1437-20131217/4883_1 /TAXON_ID=49252 ORGANISM="Eucampia antarctica, Strain CCMP1452" /NCGR_SAMPLE_ID=MMETSP1437 /ASSEMBLY_ACC=CAM_ASM_001096 /LENGTH=481 /DNA_ID=CAMNT_0043429445 /DNA_START=126 /DNA_END=1572 /DNA_ORIENTATION=+